MPRSKKTLEKFQETVLFQSPKSYTSLIYGALTVLIVFIIIFLAFRALSQRTGVITEQAPQTQTTIAQTYVVKQGDSLWSIAQNTYGDGYLWDELAKANNLQNTDVIEEGKNINLPAKEVLTGEVVNPTNQPTLAVTATIKPSDIPTLTQAFSPSPKATITLTPTVKITISPTVKPQVTPMLSGEKITGKTYTVVSGDNLWDIAVRAYGDGYKWTEIAKANNLVNPDLIHPGNNFTLPR